MVAPSGAKIRQLGFSMSENPYDRTPYGHHCHRQTHPERLATIGTLFGMSPPDPRSARVLELGCASGANLIPMAYNSPDSTFVGVDLSRKQVENGRARISDLGLDNIELDHRSILDVDESGEPFDYIICHGVFSWVDDEVRRKILRICSRRLAPQGIAQVSYNTLPGWHMVRIVRDMMRFHVRPFSAPEERAQQARALLDFMTRSWEGQDSSYAALLRSESALLADVEDSYLIHDHLADVNRPCYFYEFIDAARTEGLQYLADSSLASMLPENLPEEVHLKLREIDDIVRQEQYMDFVRGRRFRNTLLCRCAVELTRELEAKSLNDLYVDSDCAPEVEIQPHHLVQGVEVGFSSEDSTARVGGRAGKTALWLLFGKKRWPLTYRELVEEVAAELGEDLAAVESRLEQELNPCRLLFSNVLDVSVLPASHIAEIEERPSVSPLARYQASSDGKVTNQRHQTVALGPADLLILEHLDGSRTLGDLSAILAEKVREGALQLSIDGREPVDARELDELIGAYCSETLNRFRKSALLVPTGRASKRVSD